MVSSTAVRPRLRLPLLAAASLSAAALAASLPAGPAAAFGLGSLSEVTNTMEGQQGRALPANDPAAPAKKVDGALPAPDQDAAAPKLPEGAAATPEAAAPDSQPAPVHLNKVEAAAPVPAVAPVQSPAPVAAAPGVQPMAMPGKNPAASAPAGGVTARGGAPAASANRAVASPAPAVAETQAKKPAAPSGPSKDYYAERAKEVLAQEKKGSIRLHELQTAAPDYDILLCEAGCKIAGAQILTKKLKTQAVSADGRALVKADAPVVPSPVAPGKSPECVGGCSDRQMGMTNISAGGSSTPRVMGEAAGSWMTSVAPTHAKPAAKKASAEDWMARINRERDAAKPATSDTPAPAAKDQPPGPKS